MPTSPATLLSGLSRTLVLCCLVLLPTFVNSEGTSSRPVKFAVNSNAELVRTGKAEYEVLQERRRSSGQYGKCWADAILKLERNCAQLDESIQSWLAVSFTHCFLKTSGMEDELSGEACTAVIAPGQVYSTSLLPFVRKCVKSIDGRFFSTYSLFYVHTQSICFYLHSEQWQKHTESLVDNLVTSAQAVSSNLNSAVGTIHQLEELQHSSLKAQLSLNEELSVAKNSLEAFQEQTKEQRDLIEKIIDQFILLRQFLVIEFSANSAVVYYIFAMLVIYFTTTPARVASSRIVLYILLTLCFAVEKKAIDYLLRFDLLFASPLFTSSFDNSSPLTGNVWLIRKAFLILMLATYIWWAVTYRDMSLINYQILSENTVLLRNIQRQLLNSPERVKKSLSCFSDDDSGDDSDEPKRRHRSPPSTSSSTSSASSYSDYESDDSFIATDSEEEANDTENKEANVQSQQRTLRSKSKEHAKTGKSTRSLPKEYQKESADEFARTVRKQARSSSRDRLNVFSSDDEY